MNALRVFAALVRWDFILELRRRETVLNMTLFAVVILFLASYALASRPELLGEVGPIVLWISILFSGTVGLSRAFAVEREGGALHGILLSPAAPEVVYLSKVAATWLYVMVMEILTLGAYVIFFNFGYVERVPHLLAVMASFTFAYTAAGILLAAMTSALRTGEVLLRILLFPLMIPAIVLALDSGRAIFPEEISPSAPTLVRSVSRIVSLGVIYVVVGCVLFPKVVEE